MTITTKRSIIALLLSLVLVVSLFTIGISATDDKDTMPESDVEQTLESDGTDDEKGSDETESGSESESETKKPTTNNKVDKEEQKKIDETRTSLIVNGIIVAAIIIVLIFLYVKFHAKFNAFLRSVKSELKKIVWSSKENTRKGFLIVAVVAVAFGIALGLIDYAFSTGFDQLPELLLKLFN